MTALRIHVPPTPVSAEPAPDPVTLASLQARIDTLTTLLERAALTPPAAVLSVPNSVECLRTIEPGTVTLRACFDSDKARNSSRREPSTWNDYESTIDSLEQVWSGPGPDVRSLNSTSLQAAFESVSGWKSRAVWSKRRKYLIGILRSCCRQTKRNRYGIPKGESVLLTEDDLPYFELPAQKWFDSRGGEPREKLPALTVEEFDRVLVACHQTDDPVWWRTLLSHWWYCAMRRTDSMENLTWFDAKTRRGVDLTRNWLKWRAAKPPHEMHDIPLPEWLCVGFRALAKRQTVTVFHREVKDTNLSRWLYPTLKAICERAGLEYRDPTGFRDSCSTHWDWHDPQYTNKFTAHKETSVVKTHYIVPNEQQLRAACDRHPKPTIALDAP